MVRLAGTWRNRALWRRPLSNGQWIAWTGMKNRAVIAMGSSCDFSKIQSQYEYDANLALTRRKVAITMLNWRVCGLPGPSGAQPGIHKVDISQYLTGKLLIHLVPEQIARPDRITAARVKFSAGWNEWPLSNFVLTMIKMVAVVTKQIANTVKLRVRQHQSGINVGGLLHRAP